MKRGFLFLGVGLIAFVGLALAQNQEMFIEDNDGCQELAPFVWTELAPGEMWQATVDLSQCTSDELGWFRYYGYIARRTRANTLTKRDNIVLGVFDLGTGQSYGFTDTKGKDRYIRMEMLQPTRLLLSAQNLGRKNAKIRLTCAREGT